MSERDLYVAKAKYAHQAERYDDMLEFVNKLVDLGGNLSDDERNLYTLANKHAIGSRKTSISVFTGILSNKGDCAYLSNYRKDIVNELNDMCNNALKTLDEKLLPNCGDDVETKTVYLKVKADMRLNLCLDSDDDELKKQAREAYEEAYSFAEGLSPCNPVRLGLANNYAVFLYENMSDGRKACEVAKKAFDGAVAELDSLPEDSYKNSTLLMQIIRDNLNLWTSELE